MTGGSAPKVFISATSADLKGYRQEVSDALHRHGFHPVVQKYFPQDHVSLVEHLKKQLRDTVAVICLIGPVFGAMPEEQDCEPPRSYTQLEFDMARQLGLPVYAWLSSASCEIPQYPEETREQLVWQEEHRRRVMQLVICRFFSDKLSLLLLVADLVPQLLAHAHRAARGVRLINWPERPSFFTGREFELEQLQRKLTDTEPCVVVVYGIGGQGKTTLVRQVLDRLAPVGYAGIFGVSLQGEGCDFGTFLEEALRYVLEEEFNKQQTPKTEEQVQKLIECLERERLLLVIDSTERCLRGWTGGGPEIEGADAATRGSDVKGFNDFLRACTNLAGSSHLVLTTRALPEVLDNSIYAVVPVDDQERALELQGLDEESGWKLLQNLGVRASHEELKRLAVTYSCHPLALRVLAGMLVRRFDGRIDHWKPSDAMHPHAALHELFEETRKHLPRPQHTERLMRRAAHFLESPSLEQLAELDQALKAGRWAARLQTLLMPFSAVRESRAASPESTEQIRSDLCLLGDWHLLDWDTRKATLHPLARDYFASLEHGSAALHRALAWIYDNQPVPPQAHDLDEAKNRLLAITHYGRANDWREAVRLFFSPYAGEDSFAAWLGEGGHLEKGIELATMLSGHSKGRELAWLLSAQGAYLRGLGRHPLAIAVLGSAMELLNKFTMRRDLASALLNRANAFREYTPLKAAADYDEAVATLEKTWRSSARDLQLAHVLINRASYLGDYGYLTRAVADSTRALPILESFLPKRGRSARNHLALALRTHGNNLADLQHWDEGMGFLDKAKALIEDAEMEPDESLLPALAETYYLRANAFWGMLRLPEAIREARSAIAMLHRTGDRPRPELALHLALSQLTLAGLLLEVKEWQEALRVSEAALASFHHLRAQGTTETRSWMANCLLCLSEAQYHLDRRIPSRATLDEGMALFAQVAREVGGVFRTWSVMLQKAVRAMSWLSCSDPGEARRVADILLASTREVASHKRANIPEDWGIRARSACSKLSLMPAEMADPELRIVLQNIADIR